MKFNGTMPEHLLFGLREALDLIVEEGLPAIQARHRRLARRRARGRRGLGERGCAVASRPGAGGARGDRHDDPHARRARRPHPAACARNARRLGRGRARARSAARPSASAISAT